MEKDLITIIVPVYNVEKFLGTCIESIINQTYKNLEIILVNDGSTDSSLEICKKYLFDSRISIINKPNEGLSSARQIGIDIAKGKYLCMIDSDDYIEKDFVEKMYTQIKKDGSDICVCATRFYSEKINRIYGFTNNIKQAKKISRNDIESYYYMLLSYYYMSDSWNKIYRKSFIKSSGVRFSLDRKYNGTDLLFNHLLLLYLPKISVLNEPLYNHQILENSRARRKNKQLQKGFMIIMKEILNEVEKLKYSNIIIKQLNCLYVKFLREASQDIYNSSISNEELRKKISEFNELNKIFLSENKILSLKLKDMNSFSLKLYCLILKSRNSFLLINYLNTRKKLLDLLE